MTTPNKLDNLIQNTIGLGILNISKSIIKTRLGEKMDISISTALTPDDKRVWLIRAMITLVSMICFIIAYHYDGNVETSSAAVVISAMFAFAFADASVEAIFLAAMGVIIVPAIHVLVLLVPSIPLDLGVVACAISISLTTTAAIATKDKPYTTSEKSDVISTYLQAGVTYLGFFLAQHLRIGLTWV